MKSTDVVIERAVAADAQAIADLAAATFPLACPAETSEQDIRSHIAHTLSVEKFSAWLTNERAAIFAAKNAQGHFIGYVLIVLSGGDEEAEVSDFLRFSPSAELSKCYTLPQAWGAGVSAQLVHAGSAWAMENGMKGMWLGVNVFNPRAQAFYARMGFVVVGERDYHVGGRTHHDDVMEMALR